MFFLAWMAATTGLRLVFDCTQGIPSVVLCARRNAPNGLSTRQLICVVERISAHLYSLLGLSPFEPPKCSIPLGGC
jgi:hypothetical protein